MEEFLGKYKLANLNTIINYDYFGKDTNNCASFPRITAAKSELDDFTWNNNVSDELLNALCYVYIKKKKKNLDIDSCNYLYYWLGSKVLTNLRHKHFFFDVINTIYRILGKGELGKVCYPVPYNIYYYNFFKFKEVYDLSEDYNTYKSHFIKFKPSCDKDYQDELNSYLYFYKNLRDECTIKKTNYNPQYCKAFNDYFTEKENEQISSWICELQETDTQNQILEEEPGEDAENISLPEIPGLIRQKHYRQGHLETEDFAEHHSTLHTGLLSQNTLIGSFSDNPDDSSSSTLKKSITSAVSAAGVLVPPFLIYNYAPARSWINKLLGMNKGTNRNPYANQELMADFYEPEDFYSERNRYNIMYNPE